VNEEIIIERLFPSLTTGDRKTARAVIEEAHAGGVTSEEVANGVYWPVLEEINKLFRADQVTTLAHHYATRLLRQLIDQGQAGYTQRASRNKKILMFSGYSEADELAGQLTADLLEADGYEVFFGGGGIANDEILEEVGEHRPDVLLMFASAPTDAPNIRAIIDKIRGVGACPEMQMVVGGGVFNRAEGLAEEIGADLWAKSPAELIARLENEGDRRATTEQRTVGRNQRTTRSTKAA
jgi:methanogenic corrinoid protein MtbC1